MSFISYPKSKLPNDLSVNTVTASVGLKGFLYGTSSYSSDSDKLDGYNSTYFAPKVEVSSSITGAIANFITGTVSYGNITGSGTNTNPIILKNNISLASITASSTIKVDGILINGYGNVATGVYSHAEGFGTETNSAYSHAEGNGTSTYGEYSHAEGISTIAYGESSHAEGRLTRASGSGSHAEGMQTFAYGDYSHVEGESTEAHGTGSHAEGYACKAINNYSHAEGFWTATNADYQHVQGKYNALNSSALMLVGNGTSVGSRKNILEVYSDNMTISGSLNVVTNIISSTYSGSVSGSLLGTASYSNNSDKLDGYDSNYFAPKVEVTGAIANFITGVAVNGNITGSGTNANQITLKDTINLSTISASLGIKVDGILINGINNIASGLYSHAEGQQTKAIGIYSHAEGHVTEATGIYSHAEGNRTKAIGDHSHAEGIYASTMGSGSHAEGYNTKAIGDYSHAEGENTEAIGIYSHAEGYNTTASGYYTHAEGDRTHASGDNSHAEGFLSKTLGTYSHAEGFGTEASGTWSHAEGYATKAIGNYSHAEGLQTTSSVAGQHVQGKYNALSTTALMLVGNGTESVRSNILEVYSDKVIISGSISASLGNTFSGSFVGNGSGLTNLPSQALAFSPIDVGSSDQAPTAATTQYYYQTVAGATMTISKVKVWGYSGTDNVLFGIYRGSLGGIMTLIGEGSAVCSTGPNVINITAKPGQNLNVTSGEDLVVGIYQTGISWRTVYRSGISDTRFGILNTGTITSMPASPTGTVSTIRFACTIY